MFHRPSMKPLGLGLACFVIGLLTTTGVHAQQVSSRNALGIPGYGTSLDCNRVYKDYEQLMIQAGLQGPGGLNQLRDLPVLFHMQIGELLGGRVQTHLDDDQLHGRFEQQRILQGRLLGRGEQDRRGHRQLPV